MKRTLKEEDSPDESMQSSEIQNTTKESEKDKSLIEAETRKFAKSQMFIPSPFTKEILTQARKLTRMKQWPTDAEETIPFTETTDTLIDTDPSDSDSDIYEFHPFSTTNSKHNDEKLVFYDTPIEYEDLINEIIVDIWNRHPNNTGQLPLSSTVQELLAGEFYRFLTDITFRSIQLRSYKKDPSQNFYEDRGTAGGAGLVFRACEFLNIPSQAIDKTQEEVKEWLHKEEQLFPLKTKKQTTPKKKVIKQEEKKEGLKKDWIEFSGFSEICTKYNYKKCPFKVTDDTNDKIYIKCQACDKIICIEKTDVNKFYKMMNSHIGGEDGNFIAEHLTLVKKWSNKKRKKS